MAHELEHDRSAVYARSRAAWHKLGIVLPDDALTTQRIFELIPEIASPVESQPVFTIYGDEAVIADGYAANVRSLDGKLLGIVSDRYRIVQNAELFQLGEDIVDVGGAIWDTAGTLRDGKYVWGCMKLPDDLKVLGMDSETMEAYIMLGNSFDGSTGVVASASYVRTVCMNTWQAAVGGASRKWSLRHTESVGGRIREARDALALTIKLGDAIAEEAEVLARQSITPSDALKLTKRLMPVPKQGDVTERTLKNVEERRMALHDLYMTADNLENIRGNKYGWLQAVGEYEQHVVRRSVEKRFEALLEEDGALFGKARTILLEA
jgi:phage/plasmid-like protein (TIGR03299 family)